MAGDGQWRALTPALILFIALPDPQDKSAFELHAFPLVLLPRRCPRCGFDTIIGHGERRKQSHDEQHDWIWIRRGLCPPCGETFTILPSWSSPYGQYSLRCRQQAWESSCNRRGAWEQAAPQWKDPNRFPDPATLRRWACRRLWSQCCSVKAFWFYWPGWQTFWRAPTILAWHWAVVERNLQLEANSP